MNSYVQLPSFIYKTLFWYSQPLPAALTFFPSHRSLRSLNLVRRDVIYMFYWWQKTLEPLILWRLTYLNLCVYTCCCKARYFDEGWEVHDGMGTTIRHHALPEITTVLLEYIAYLVSIHKLDLFSIFLIKMFLSNNIQLHSSNCCLCTTYAYRWLSRVYLFHSLCPNLHMMPSCFGTACFQWKSQRELYGP